MAGLKPKPVREFTRADPCTKVHLFQCFRAADGKGYYARAVVEARGEIGVNAIKYLIREGYAAAYDMRSVEYWELTSDGIAWLEKGLIRELELHPERRRNVTKPMPNFGQLVAAPKHRRITRRTY